jgi:hypothetical protein
LVRFVGRGRFNFYNPAFDLGISFFRIQATQRQILFFLNVTGETDYAVFLITFAPANGLTMNEMKFKRFASLWERLSCCRGNWLGKQAVAPLNSKLMPPAKQSQPHSLQRILFLEI